MYRDKRIALVIPAHNEEKLIRPTLDKVPSFVDKVFVVDDASPDRTAETVREKARADSRITLIEHGKNQGVGAAIITGYRQAAAEKFDITVVIGGDDQMPQEQMDRLLNPIIDGKADYTKGNRFLENDAPFTLMPRIRLVGNTMISLLTKIASGYYRIFDAVDGYTAITREAIEKIDWSRAWKGYGFPMDFLVRLNAYNLRAMDVPRRAIYLPGERQSQIKGFSYALRVSPMLLKNFIWRLGFRYIYRDFHPLVMLFMGSAFFLFTGFLVGLWILVSKLRGVVPSAGTAVICSLLISMGIQSFFFGMLFEMLEDQKRG